MTKIPSGIRDFCRLLSVFGLICFVSLPVSAQKFDLKPGATLVVKEQSTTAEMVDITMLNPTVPESVMKTIALNLGKELGVTPRGFPYYVESFGTRPQDRFVKARIATEGLISRETGTLNLQAIARAFCNLPKPYTIDTIQVTFDGEVPNAATIRSFANTGVVVDGQVIANPQAIRYQIYLQTQDPQQVQIPLRHVPETKPVPKPAASTGVQPMVVALIVVASVAAGCLVYFLALSKGKNRQPNV